MADRKYRTQGTRDPAREVREFTRWVEDEYDVEAEWAYVPVVGVGRDPRIRCVLTLAPVPWSETQDVHWMASCEWPQGTSLKAMEAHRLYLVSQLAIDLQFHRAFGLDSCEYAFPFPPAVP